MSSKSDIFEKTCRFVDSASDTIKDITKEAEEFAHVKIQNALNSMGVVKTDELEAIRCMASKIHDELSSVNERLDKVEKDILDLKSILENK
ncbi:accessory factor UbiK family protein [Candidatus Liberibacter americanus]|uniref:Uncharacterized protein n=1 Tax=Candidatus Liberibacter americanus str. Sao Paulo TaxID=1261131 RepID=U6B6C3_9HYPH|nr:accessory factor UbiK family protein [Candidatus Liberibacter americanus]AHA27421.1 hypothetical protein lam_037 [Candidatus Liberibacter americanus str. Sao Paulo]EMS36694.1 hypothetical protein G653_00565 [Candidatus Liberibacter americanus PW_SP]